MAEVLILMGSLSDKEKVLPCAEILQSLNISWEIAVCSAHRSPDRLLELMAKAEKEDIRVFICAAGMAAHLAGAVAARTIRPVIGVPIDGSSLSGMDALFSTVQMPPGYPVATVALGAAGAKNSAWLAAQILAIGRPGLAKTIGRKREEMREEILQASAKLQAEASQIRKS